MRGTVAKRMRRWTRSWISVTGSEVPFRKAYRHLKKSMKARKKGG